MQMAASFALLLGLTAAVYTPVRVQISHNAVPKVEMLVLDHRTSEPDDADDDTPPRMVASRPANIITKPPQEHLVNHSNATRPHVLAHNHSNVTDRSAIHKEHAAIVSGWLAFHVSGNATPMMKQPKLGSLVGALRESLGEMLEVCRQTVSVSELRVAAFDTFGLALAQTSRSHSGSVVRKAKQRAKSRWVWSDPPEDEDGILTQLKVSYEVRIFGEARISEQDAARRIDRFQVYTSFNDLERSLRRALQQADVDKVFEDPVLDDVGYATTHKVHRAKLSPEKRADCREEVLLYDARRTHQYMLLLSLGLLVLITFAGSAIFAVKHVSTVPSRWNPLLSEN